MDDVTWVIAAISLNVKMLESRWMRRKMLESGRMRVVSRAIPVSVD